MITAQSRYANTPLAVVDTAAGKRQVLGIDAPQDRVVEFTYYQVIEGDTIDGLADEQFEDGTLWWVIADANPEILDWHTLLPGTILRIPNA